MATDRSTMPLDRNTRLPRGLGWVCLGLAWLLTTGCGNLAEGAATDNGPQQEVLAEVERYYADFSARDWEAFASHFWPGATLTTVWQPPGEDVPRVVITGLDEFVAQAPEGPGSREIFEERMLDADATVYGNLAQVWARYEARFGDPGDIMEWRGYDAFTLMRHDGQWKIVSLSYTNEEGDAP